VYWERGGGSAVCFVDVTAHLKEYMETLMNRTSKAELLGESRVYRTATRFRSFEVTKVERVENVPLWEAYASKRELLGKDQRVSPTALGRQPATSEYEPPFPACLSELANEFLLFHGTERRVADIMAHHGFAEAVSSLGGFWGGGIYFAENASKSDEYVPPGETGTMVVARVVLGRPHIQREALDERTRRLRRTACVEGHLDTVHGPCAHKRCDSLIADCKAHEWLKRYREFVVYQAAQTYPGESVRE
jgi:hypothetical protein